MSRLAVLGTLLPALMCSTAFAADVLQDAVIVEDAPAFTLTGTAGIVGFNLADFDSGVFGATDDSLLWGGMIGISGSGALDQYNGWDVVLGFNAFAAFAGGDSSSSRWTADGPGTLIISGVSTPGGVNSIDLETDNGTSSGTVDIVNNNPQTGGADGVGTVSGGTDNVGFVVPADTGNSFILGAVTTGPGSAAAYGAIADTDGGIFIATGDIDGLTVQTSVSRDLIYTGADLTLGLGGDLQDGVVAHVYAGPSYRGLFQDYETDININIAEVDEDTVVTLPDLTISRLDEVDTNYLGGVVGGNLLFGANDGVVFRLGVEGGVYSAMASWTGTDTYSTCCGDFGPDPEDEDFQGGLSPDLTVTSDSVTDNFDSELAFALRGSGGVTWGLDANTSVTLGGSIEYLSKVASLQHGELTTWTPGGADDASWDETDGPPPDAVLSWDSMVNFALTASLTGHF